VSVAPAPATAAAIHPVASARWLALTPEDVLVPDRAIVDPRHHLYGPPRVSYLYDEFVTDARAGHRIAFALPSGNLATSLGRAAMCHFTSRSTRLCAPR
jgi:hypothetical protein